MDKTGTAIYHRHPKMKCLGHVVCVRAVINYNQKQQPQQLVLPKLPVINSARGGERRASKRRTSACVTTEINFTSERTSIILK